MNMEDLRKLADKNKIAIYCRFTRDNDINNDDNINVDALNRLKEMIEEQFGGQVRNVIKKFDLKKILRRNNVVL